MGHVAKGKEKRKLELVLKCLVFTVLLLSNQRFSIVFAIKVFYMASKYIQDKLHHELQESDFVFKP